METRHPPRTLLFSFSLASFPRRHRRRHKCQSSRSKVFSPFFVFRFFNCLIYLPKLEFGWQRWTSKCESMSHPTGGRSGKKKKIEFRRPAKCHEDTKCVECVPQWVGEMKKDEKFKKKKKRPDLPPFVRSHVTKTHGGNQSGLRVYACTGSLRVNRSTRLEHAKLCRVLPTRKRPGLLLQCLCSRRGWCWCHGCLDCLPPRKSFGSLLVRVQPGSSVKRTAYYVSNDFDHFKWLLLLLPTLVFPPLAFFFVVVVVSFCCLLLCTFFIWLKKRTT